MAKRVTKTVTTETVSNRKKPSKRKKSTSTVKSIKGAKSEIDKKVLQNLIELQKVHADLAEKFDGLAKQISSLLVLFENAARSFATRPGIKDSEKDKEFLDKIDKLLDQNKTIAKGLSLMEEKFRKRVYGPEPQQAPVQGEEEYQPSLSPSNRPLPRF